MSSIKFVKRSEIDIKKWQACCEQSDNFCIYVNYWYLDIMCENQWVALVQNDYEAVMPLPVRKKWGLLPYIYQPFFTQQLGIFYPTETPVNLMAFIKAIPRKYVKVNLQIHNYLPELKLKAKTNYLLPLNKSYTELEKNYSRDARKNLAKCEGVRIDPDISIEEIVNLNKEVWGPLNASVQQKDYNNFIRVCYEAEKHNSLIKIKVSMNGELHGAALFLIGTKRIHYLCGAPTAEGRKYSSMHAIIDHIIQRFANTNKVLDFEGSELENVAVFYKKFGAVKENYYLYKNV